MQEIKKKNKIFVFGILIIVIGVIIGIIPIFLDREEKIIENEKLDNYIMETSIKHENSEDVKTEKVDVIKDNSQHKNDEEEKYLMILEIPKLKLRKGIYPITSKLNSIEHNVAIMEESSLPDVTNGNLILAAHNGTGKIAFFNKLHKLTKNDKAYIYYQGFKYTYVIDDIYNVLKDGDVEIKRDLNKTTLTLVTCQKDTKDRQLVIVLYLSNKEEY